MAVVARFQEGFEHGISPATAGGGLAAAVTGTPTVGTSYARGPHSTYGLQINPVASADESVDFPTFTGQAISAMSFFVKPVTLDTSSAYNICALQGQAGFGQIGVTTSNTWRFTTSGGTNTTDSSIPVIIGKWTLVELFADMHANPWTFKWRIDGVDCPDPGTWAQALTTFKQASLGCFAPGTRTTEFHFDDLVVFDGASTDTAAIWPMGGFKVVGITADQAAAAAHQSITATQWQYTDDFSAFTNFTGATETDSRSRIDELTTANGIRMNGGASGQAGNARWPVAVPPDYGTPRAVSLQTVSQEASTGTNNAIFRTLVGASTTDHFNANPGWGTTWSYLFSCMDTKPGGGAWTLADVDAINFEADSTDSAPAIHLGGFVYQVSFPERGPLPESVIAPVEAVQRSYNW